MPVIVAALLGGLIQLAGTLVGRVLIALGIGFVTYKGVNVGLDFFKSLFLSAVGSSGATAAGIIHTLQIDRAFGLILSAITAKLVVNGMQSGAIRRMAGK